MTGRKKEQFSMTIDPETLHRIDALAEALGTSLGEAPNRSAMIRHLLRLGLETEALRSSKRKAG